MEKGQKKEKMHLPIIWIERIPLLQVHFSYFTAKQGTIFKGICIKEGNQLCSSCSSSGLIYYGLANWSFHLRRQIPLANYFIISIYYENFLYFFLNQFFQKIVFLPSENQKTFSEKCSLISVILQGLVKTCEKYIEVNHFLLLGYSLEK